MENSNGIISREKLDQVANWVSATVSSAFFSSLERCSCVNLTTTDPEDDEEEEANDRPLTSTTTTTTTTTSTTTDHAPPNDIVKLPV